MKRCMFTIILCMKFEKCFPNYPMQSSQVIKTFSISNSSHYQRNYWNNEKRYTFNENDISSMIHTQNTSGYAALF